LTGAAAALVFGFAVGLVLGASLGGVTVISGSVAWPRAHSSTACTESAVEATNRIRLMGVRIVGSPDAGEREKQDVQGTWDANRVRGLPLAGRALEKRKSDQSAVWASPALARVVPRGLSQLGAISVRA
jgi:hypothetical protein